MISIQTNRIFVVPENNIQIPIPIPIPISNPVKIELKKEKPIYTKKVIKYFIPEFYI
jgi:hypothetical protein